MRPLRKPRLFLPIWPLHFQRIRKARKRVEAARPAMRMLQALLIGFGGAMSLAAIGNFFLGPADMARAMERAYIWASGDPHCLTAFYPAGADGTIRSLAPLWMIFGVFMASIAFDLRRRIDFVPILASIVFVGGVGRALSYVDVGQPHPVFLALLAVELGVPALMMALWSRA